MPTYPRSAAPCPPKISSAAPTVKSNFPLAEPADNLDVRSAAHAAGVSRWKRRDFAQERDEFGIDPLLLAFDPGGVDEEFAARLGEERQVVRVERKVRGLLPAVGHYHVATIAFAATEV